METVAIVRHVIQPNDWAFSLDLTDACLPIHKASWKYHHFCLRGQVFQLRALPFQPGHKSICFYSVDGCRSNAIEENFNNPVSIPGRLAGENQNRLALLKDSSVHSSIDFLSRANNQSGEIRINSLSNFCFRRDGTILSKYMYL